jgi:hypothetical protein
MAAADARWQRLSKTRRASVYRAVGRAARVAREDRDAELSGDLRVIMNVLRAHAKAPSRAAKAPSRAANKPAKKRTSSSKKR